MKNLFSRNWPINLSVLCALALSANSMALDLNIVTLNKLSETRIDRTTYDYVFSVTIQNGAQAVNNAAQTLTASGVGTSIIDGSVLLGNLTSGEQVTPADTIKIRHNRALPFDQTALVWSASGTLVSSSSSAASSVANLALLSEPFTIDKATLFSTAYRSISTDSSVPLFFVTGGNSGITIANNELTLAAARFTIGHKPPRTNTTSSDTSANGDFDLSKPYRISFRVVASSGSGAVQVMVTSGTQLNAALRARATMSIPITILVNGTINHGNTTAQGCNTQADVIEIKQMSNISIIGVGINALFDEIGIHVRDASNVIIQNVHVRNVKKSGSPTSNGGDAIGMESDVDRVWIDHNKLEASGGEQEGYDSLLDMKDGVTNVTVSYNVFNDSSRAGLIGFTDTDDKNNNITVHHNWYKNIEQRTPLIRNALVHVYNNYWSNPSLTYMFHAINSRANAKVLVESNYFFNVNNPLIASDDSSTSGCWQTNNENTVLPSIYYSRSVGNGALVVPDIVNGQLQSTCVVTVPYSAAMDNSVDVPALVMANTGVGIISGNAGVSSSSGSTASSVASVSSSPASSVASSGGTSSTASSSPVMASTNLPMLEDFSAVDAESII